GVDLIIFHEENGLVSDFHVVSFLCELMIRCSLGQGKKECGSLADGGFNPDRPPIYFNDFFYQRQTHARAFYTVTRGQRLKEMKNPLEMARLDAGPVIGYAEFPVL